MKATILGIESVSYTSKKTNLPVSGIKVYYASPLDATRGIGMKADNAFISSNVPFSAQVGDVVEIFYNRYGSVEEVRNIEKK